jgi:hypothetical protein
MPLEQQLTSTTFMTGNVADDKPGLRCCKAQIRPGVEPYAVSAALAFATSAITSSATLRGTGS